MNALHHAARDGSPKRTMAVLSQRVIDIDEGDRKGYTALMFAAFFGYAQVVTILLEKGANVFIVNDDGFTALHVSAQGGHLAVTKLLVKAGADLEAAVSHTPLQLAAEGGYSEVMRVLIEAGAKPNSRLSDGSTSLYTAAFEGHVGAVKVLLRAGANPLLTFSSPSGPRLLPLDAAAREGHSEVVDLLIQEYGIEGCGGVSGGVDALAGAAENKHVEILRILTSAGVVDTGKALVDAAASACASSVKFLLQQERRANGRGVAYPDTRHRNGSTPLVLSLQACRPCSPRIARLFVDAGADTASAFRLTDGISMEIFNDTPLALVDMYIFGKTEKASETTESELNSLEASRRLLMRVEAVHALSWLWPSDDPSITHAGAARGTTSKGKAKKVSTPLLSMLPIVRRRVRRPKVLLAALFRWVMRDADRGW